MSWKRPGESSCEVKEQLGHSVCWNILKGVQSPNQRGRSLCQRRADCAVSNSGGWRHTGVDPWGGRPRTETADADTGEMGNAWGSGLNLAQNVPSHTISPLGVLYPLTKVSDKRESCVGIKPSSIMHGLLVSLYCQLLWIHIRTPGSCTSLMKSRRYSLLNPNCSNAIGC